MEQGQGELDEHQLMCWRLLPLLNLCVCNANSAERQDAGQLLAECKLRQSYGFP